MISDEPDEDADELDDETMLETYLTPAKVLGPDVGVDILDWPVAESAIVEVGFNLDNATVAWFQANHANWRREIGSVLRGWIAAHADTGRVTPRLG